MSAVKDYRAMLVSLTEARDIIDVNIAAGIALQKLDKRHKRPRKLCCAIIASAGTVIPLFP